MEKLRVYGFQSRRRVDRFLEKHPNGLPGDPDPFGGGWGPRNAHPHQLEGPELSAEELGRDLNLSASAVTKMARKSYELIEAELWVEITKRIFRDEIRKRDCLELLIYGDRPYGPMSAFPSTVVNKLERITAFLDGLCAAQSVGSGWVRPTPKAWEFDRLSFLWRGVTIRRFPSSTNGLIASKDCDLITDSNGLAFAITKRGGDGRGKAWMFRRARVEVVSDNWINYESLPPYVVCEDDIEEIPKFYFTASTRQSAQSEP